MATEKNLRVSFVDGCRFTLPVSKSKKKRRLQAVRAWQARAYRQLGPHMARLIVAATGSGKSYLLKMLALRDLAMKVCQKVILVVPQKVIANGFVSCDPEAISFPDGKSGVWVVSHDLTKDGSGPVAQLVEFITNPAASALQTVAVCTYGTLLAAFKCLRDEVRSDGESVFQGIGLMFDEAHHSGYFGDSASGDNDNAFNRCGSVINQWVLSEYGPVTLATATWFRGDQFQNVSAKIVEKFERFDLGLDEYLREMFPNGIDISISFVVGDPLECVSEIVRRNPSEKTIAWVPHAKHDFIKAHGTKYDAAHALRSVWGPYKIQTGSTFGRHRYGRHVLYSADLVTEEGREDVLAEIRDVVRQGSSSHSILPQVPPNLILAMNMGKEGFDYPALTRGIVIGDRGSTLDFIQMFGRIIRAAPDKKHAHFNIVLPYNQDIGETDREQIKDYLKLMVTSMVLTWSFASPLRDPEFSQLSAKSKQEVQELLKDLKAQAEAAAALALAGVNADSSSSAEDLVSSLLPEVLPGYLSLNDEAKKAVVRLYLNLFSSKSKQMMRSVADVPFDLGMVGGTFGCIQQFGKSFEADSLTELRAMLEGRFLLTEDLVRSWGESVKRRLGRYPTREDKTVCLPESRGLTWKRVDAALVQGAQGLKRYTHGLRGFFGTYQPSVIQRVCDHIVSTGRPVTKKQVADALGIGRLDDGNFSQLVQSGWIAKTPTGFVWTGKQSGQRAMHKELDLKAEAKILRRLRHAKFTAADYAKFRGLESGAAASPSLRSLRKRGHIRLVGDAWQVVSIP